LSACPFFPYTYTYWSSCCCCLLSALHIHTGRAAAAVALVAGFPLHFSSTTTTTVILLLVVLGPHRVLLATDLGRSISSCQLVPSSLTHTHTGRAAAAVALVGSTHTHTHTGRAAAAVALVAGFPLHFSSTTTTVILLLVSSEFKWTWSLIYFRGAGAEDERCGSGLDPALLPAQPAQHDALEPGRRLAQGFFI
jgi:hypothetical protein